MAIIKVAAPLVGIRGSIGGTTYSANKSGPYARAWTAPPNKRRPLQMAQRNTFAWASEIWRTRTGAQRAAWDAWAALIGQIQTNSLGETYYLSGFQWYVRCNTRLELMGRAWLTNPPAGAYPADPTINSIVVAADANGGAGQVTYPANEFVGFDLVLCLAVTQGWGSISCFRRYTFLEYTQAPGNANEWFTTPLRAKMGWVLTGNRYHSYTWRQSSEGLRSAAIYAQAVSG